MRNTLKATTLETKLPILAVEHGCIISKDTDITVAFEVSLPELFTVTSQEYEAMHAAWCCPTTRGCTNRTGSSVNAINRSYRTMICLFLTEALNAILMSVRTFHIDVICS